MLRFARKFWMPALTFVLLGSGVALLMPEQGSALVAAAHGDDASTLLGKRSPGERAKGALYQTKLARNDVAPGPAERVLSEVRTRTGAPPEGGVPGGVPPGGAVFPPANGFAPVDGGVVSPTADVGPSFADGGPGIFPVLGGLSPGSGGGGDTVTTPPTDTPPTDTPTPSPTATPTPVPTPTTTPPVTAAVPEPATWVSMIVGFAAIGAVSRRRRRLGAPAAS